MAELLLVLLALVAAAVFSFGLRRLNRATEADIAEAEGADPIVDDPPVADVEAVGGCANAPQYVKDVVDSRLIVDGVEVVAYDITITVADVPGETCRCCTGGRSTD